MNQGQRRPFSGNCFDCSAPGHYTCEWPERIAGGGRFYGGRGGVDLYIGRAIVVMADLKKGT